MLFKRREPAKVGEKVRVALWPRRSWDRSVRYMLQRMWRLQGTPESIALGCSCGVFASFTPFVGFHFVVAAVLALILRGSLLASAIGTFIGNPLTFPFIWYATYQIGSVILGSDAKFSIARLQDGFGGMMAGLLNFSSSAFASAVDLIWPLVKPMLVGSLPLGLPVAFVCYFVFKRLVAVYQEQRRQARGFTNSV